MKTSSIPTALPNRASGRKRGRAGHNLQLLACCALLLLISGCASYGKVENLQTPEPATTPQYSLRSFAAAANPPTICLGALITYAASPLNKSEVWAIALSRNAVSMDIKTSGKVDPVGDS